MTARHLIHLLLPLAAVAISPQPVMGGSANLTGKLVKPNPFTEGTEFELTMPKEGRVRVVVFNVLGQRVKTLISDELYKSGVYRIDWDGRDEADNPIPPGVYVCVLYAENKPVSSVKAIKV